MTTRRSLLLSSAALAAAQALPPVVRAQDATPAAALAAADASVLLGEWKGDYVGYQRGEPFSHPVTFIFTDAHGALVFGKQIIPLEDGAAAEEATSLALLSDGHFIGADNDGLKFGNLLPDGSLNIFKLEAGLDDGAFFSILRKDGQPAAEPTRDASALLGRWVGTLNGFQQGEMTTGLWQIDITDATGPAFTGSRSYKVGDADWSEAGLTEGLISEDGHLYRISSGGYSIGEMLDDDTMRLAYLEVGMDNAALILDLHRQSANLAAATPAVARMPAIDLIGCWTGTGEQLTSAGVIAGTSELTVTDGKDGFFTGARRWKPEAGDWYPAETVNIVILPDGTLAMADEDSYLLGRLLEDGTLEIAHAEPASPEPTVISMRLTRGC